jgi:flagellar assembly protein FliH
MSKLVIPREEAETVAVAYSPRKLPSTIPPAAHDFVAINSKKEGKGFRIDRLIAQQTGVSELERISLEEKVEHEVLARIKTMQEQAYQEAYQLGLDDGREKAFTEFQDELSQSLARLVAALESIENLKSELIACNEKQIVRLIYYIARRLVLHEVSVKPEIILDVVKMATEIAASDENVTVKVSSSDFAFIESVKDKLGKDFNQIRKVQLESSEDVHSGGCIVETNFGEVNATLDQRLEKVWATITEKLPKVKTVVGAE